MGETAFDDEETEGRTKSLAASLNYGFENAFTEDERKILALLYFFQRFVDVGTLLLMGDPDEDYALPALRNQIREILISLLDRAAEVGLLTALGGGYYTIHPALPWFFKGLFERLYPEDPLPERAFVEAVGALGDYYWWEYEGGNRDVIAPLIKEEPNLLHARRIAHANEWWGPVTSAMQGLRNLYDQTGRRAEWKRLVEEDFVDPSTDGPLPGRQDQWGFVMGYRIRLVMEERNWVEAERLQKAHVAWHRKQAAPYLEMPPENLDGAGRNMVRTLAASLHEFGRIKRDMGSVACVDAYEESLELSEKIGERSGAAICAFNIGQVYARIPGIRDLEKAGQWIARSLSLTDEGDQQGREHCLGEMGFVALERFEEARVAKKPDEELLEHINTALRHYQTALEMIPANAVDDLAVTHRAIGTIYFTAGDVNTGITHWQDAIRYQELQKDYFSAAETRFNVAIALAQSGRIPDALDYARAAMRNFEMYGDLAAADIEKTKMLIQKLSEPG